jgi:DNA-binding CsgD family transcriptional regulator
VDRPRVLLAGGQSLMAESFGRLLAPSCDVVGRVAGDGDLMTAAEQLRPDVIVFDREGLVGALTRSVPAANGHELTARQREVLKLLTSGRSMKQVGKLLNIAARTVAFHKYQIMERLNIKTNAELIKYAVRHDIA